MVIENLRKFVAPEIIFGNGSRYLAGEYCKKFYIAKPMIVTDPGVMAAGWTDQVAQTLIDHDIPHIIFSQVYSEPYQGTLFKIYWPAASHKTAPSKKTATRVENLSGHEKILLVEDNTEVCAFAANALMSLGYEVHKAFNGKEALELIQAGMKKGEKLSFDLVITDLIMPKLNGKEFIKKAAVVMPEIKVIYVSGYTDNHIVHDGMLEDGVNFIQKPYSQQVLARMVRNVLDRSVAG